MKYIGLDVGYGYTKAMDGNKTIVFPSVVSPPVEMRFDPLWDHTSDSLNRLSATFDGKHYFLGEMALRQGRFAHATLDRIRTQTEEYRVLFLTAIALLIQSPGEEISIVTGLPVDDLSDKEFIEKTLKGPFSLRLGEREIHFQIDSLVVMPQPCGAFMDLLFLNSGGVNEIYSDGSIGVIDIGYKTTDFVLMRSQEYAHKRSGSIKQGMSSIYQAGISKFSSAYRGNWDLRRVEEVIRDGHICRLGESIPLNPALLDGEFSGLAEGILAWIRQQWSDERIDRILCAGGGSLPLRKYLSKESPQMTFLTDPQQSNVRGFYKGARYYFGF